MCGSRPLPGLRAALNPCSLPRDWQGDQDPAASCAQALDLVAHCSRGSNSNCSSAPTAPALRAIATRVPPSSSSRSSGRRFLPPPRSWPPQGFAVSTRPGMFSSCSASPLRRCPVVKVWLQHFFSAPHTRCFLLSPMVSEDHSPLLLRPPGSWNRWVIYEPLCYCPSPPPERQLCGPSHTRLVSHCIPRTWYFVGPQQMFDE